MVVWQVVSFAASYSTLGKESDNDDIHSVSLRQNFLLLMLFNDVVEVVHSIKFAVRRLCGWDDRWLGDGQHLHSQWSAAQSDSAQQLITDI